MNSPNFLGASSRSALDAEGYCLRKAIHSSGSSGGKTESRADCPYPHTEIKALLGGLNLRERTLVLLAASTGLRQSELFGVKWCDIDFAQHTMNVVRTIVYGVARPYKTESSQKPVPVHPTVLEALGKWRKLCRYNKSDDWVFASRRYRGRKPVWGQAILRKYIRPAAQRVGIQKRFGWHTFRHTYSTLLRSVGTASKVMQELLRHSSFRSTLDVYTQAISPAKHAAQAAVLALVFTAGTNATS
jgi:integrase